MICNVFLLLLAFLGVFMVLKGYSQKINETFLSPGEYPSSVNNILLDGPNLRAYRHFPNVGKRKSWAAADASRRGIELAIISNHKDEIYDSVQNEDKWGFEYNFLNNSKIHTSQLPI